MFSTINPRTNERIADYHYMNWDDIRAKIEIADQSFLQWSKCSIMERRALMSTFADLLERQVEELANLISLEMGKLHGEAEAEVKKCAFLARHCADHIEEWMAPREVKADGYAHELRPEPIGATLVIMPWNFPFWQVLRAAIPSLLGGNVCLLKHAESTTGCGKKIEELFLQAGFPVGVFQQVICDHQVAAKVISHPSIRLVSFTGSCRGGREIAKTAGEALTKCILELGGSDPFLVLNEADVEKAVAGALLGRFLNAGQVCIAAKRFIIQSKIAPQFIERFVTEAKKLSLAPLINKQGLVQLEAQVQDAIQRGAKVLCGGVTPTEGLIYPPTVLSEISREMKVWQEEVFGPVAPIMVVETVQEMIDLANESEYGLGASVWTTNLNEGQKLCREVQCGAVFLNSIVKSDPRVPFGGIKNSGFGLEMTEYGLLEVMNLKSYNFYSGT